MTLLRDTHAFLWWRTDSPRLKRNVRLAVATADRVWISAASGWEAAIKQSLGKLKLAASFPSMVDDSQCDELPITLRHAERAGVLSPHHADPFDRMLIAQALLAGATIVNHDRQCAGYDVPILWV